MKKKTQKTRASKKAKSVKNMTQTHGKEETFQATTLDQVWGDDGTSKYPTQKEDEYLSSLKEMTRIDIQAHATQVGLIPVENREVLEQRMLREFRRHWAQYKRPISTDNSVEISQEVKSILEEGR
jgi:hypothetical protein